MTSQLMPGDPIETDTVGLRAIEAAAEAWLRARYFLLRESTYPAAVQGTAISRTIAAEEALILALSGKTDIVEAVAALGWALAPGDQPGGKYAPKEPPRKPARERVRIQRSILD